MPTMPQHPSRSTSGRRIAAIGALTIGFVSLGLALILAVQDFPQGLLVLALVCVAGLVGWYGLRRRGAVRAVGLSVAVVAFVAAVLLVVGERAVEIALIVGGFVATGACADFAVSRRAHLASAAPPEHPVRHISAAIDGAARNVLLLFFAEEPIQNFDFLTAMRFLHRRDQYRECQNPRDFCVVYKLHEQLRGSFSRVID